jgi:hypothetical protein
MTMKYALLFLLLSASGDASAPAPGSPAHHFDNQFARRVEIDDVKIE